MSFKAPHNMAQFWPHFLLYSHPHSLSSSCTSLLIFKLTHQECFHLRTLALAIFFLWNIATLLALCHLLSEAFPDYLKLQDMTSRMKNSEESLCESGNVIKWSTFHIMGGPEGEESEKGAENLFKEWLKLPKSEERDGHRSTWSSKFPKQIQPKKIITETHIIKLSKSKERLESRQMKKERD